MSDTTVETPPSPPPYLLGVLYGLASLTVLWGAAGGDTTLLWSRSWALGLLLSLWAALALWWDQKQQPSMNLLAQLRRPTPRQIAVGTGAALALFLPLLVALMLLLSSDAPVWEPYKSFVLEFQPTWIGIFVWSVLAAPAAEILVRGAFVPAWGAGWIAFLEALTVGFALQHALPFFLLWGWGWAAYFILRTHGLGPAVLARALLTLLLLATLKNLGT